MAGLLVSSNQFLSLNNSKNEEKCLISGKRIRFVSIFSYCLIIRQTLHVTILPHHQRCAQRSNNSRSVYIIYLVLLFCLPLNTLVVGYAVVVVVCRCRCLADDISSHFYIFI